MIHCYYFLPVRAKASTLWQVLKNKVDHPEDYISGVRAVKFQELEDGSCLRSMERDGILQREKISMDYDRRLIRFDLRQHEQFCGHMEMQIIVEAGQVFLRFELSWQGARNEPQAASVRDFVYQAMKATIKQAEQLAAMSVAYN